jgi:hypothetical protein
MRPLLLTCLILPLLLVAGCSSAGRAGGGPGASGDSAASPPGSSAERQPGPAPSDSDGLQISGPVAVSLLSRSGPLQPAGPYLGRDLAGLLGRYRTALGGQQPTCLPAGCWADARIPANTVLLAVRPAPVACYQLLSVRTARTTPAAVRLDLQLNYVCRTGAGSAARMDGWLLALPVPVTAGINVTVRVSLRPGTEFSTLGIAAL